MSQDGMPVPIRDINVRSAEFYRSPASRTMTLFRPSHSRIGAGVRALSFAAIFAVWGIPLSAADDQFPEGPGKAVLLKVCTQCHSADPVLTLHRTREEWKDTVDAMKGYGAEATDEQLGIILDYLVKNFGKS